MNRDETIMALYNAVVAALQAGGMEHGIASVIGLPDGSFVVVARPTVEAPEDQETAADFVGGGGSFGGGGASGGW